MDKQFGNYHLKQQGDVYVLHMNDGENKYNEESVKCLHSALDAVESTTGPCALVFVGEGKFFSTGLDLAWLGTQSKEVLVNFLRTFQKLLARVLALPFPTIAAMNGHAYAGGAIFSLCCDWRYMRIDRGFWCLPEVDIHMPLTPGLDAVISARLATPALFRDAVLLAKKFSGPEAKKAHIIDDALSEDKLLNTALELAGKLAPRGEDRVVFGAIKRENQARTLALLTQHSLGEGEKALKSKL